MTKIMYGKLGADVIDTTKRIWSAQDDPTSEIWVPKDNPAWRDELRERMRDEHDSGLDGGDEPVIDEPLCED